MAEPRAGHPPGLGRLGAEALPLPAAGLQLVQLVGVLSVLDHAAEDEDAGAVHHETVGGASRRDVALDRRYEPLVRGWKVKKASLTYCTGFLQISYTVLSVNKFSVF